MAKISTDKIDETRGRLAAFVISVGASLVFGMLVILMAVCYGVLSLELFTATLVFVLSILSMVAFWSRVSSL